MKSCKCAFMLKTFSLSVPHLHRPTGFAACLINGRQGSDDDTNSKSDKDN